MRTESRLMTMCLMVLALVTTIACTKPDDKVTRLVQQRLSDDPIVRAYHLDVTTEQRVVSLAGTVDTSVAKDQALTIARGTTGVAEVRDHIAVRDNEGTKGWLKKSTGAMGTTGR